MLRIMLALVCLAVMVNAAAAPAVVRLLQAPAWRVHEGARDFVVLLEGRISIERNGQTVTMEQAQSLYMAPTGQASLPVAAVDPADLGRWAQETEPQAAAGQRDTTGRYRLMLPVADSQDEGRNLLKRLAMAGYGAELATTPFDGRVSDR